MYNTRYKDRNPIDTVNNIKNILTKLGVRVEEDTSESGVGTYSVQIRGFYKKAYIGFGNGKGSTKEFALASGYAEFMERTQNKLHSVGVSPLTTVIFGENSKIRFLAHKNEKYLSAEEVINSNGDIINSFIALYGREYYHNILKFESQKICDKKALVCVPFRKIWDDSYIEYIPQVNRLSNLGSNGMCTGNTREEALTQGLSEIFERYVQIQISNHDLDIPTIPNEDIKTLNKEIYNIIQNIEKSGEYKVIVKECSLGCGFPVIAVILMQKSTKSYFVNFGSSPVFEIALERCLTEIFQGATLKSIEENSLAPFMYFDEHEANYANDFRLIKDGVGVYTNKFILSNNNNYSLSHYSNKEKNTDFMAYFAQLCRQNNCEAYVADFSHLGFPTYHIYIPNFSYVDTNYDICQAEDDVLNALFFLKERTFEEYKNNIRPIANAFKVIDGSKNNFIRYFIPYLAFTTKRLKYDYLKQYVLYTYLKFSSYLCVKNYALAAEPFLEYINTLTAYVNTNAKDDSILKKHLDEMCLLRTFLSFAVRRQEHQLFNSFIFSDEEKRLFESIVKGGNEIKKVLFENDVIFDEEATSDSIEYFIKYSEFKQ